MNPSLDEQVRAADRDRWLSSRFVADGQARDDLIALYAFEAELLAIPTRVTQPLLAEMRYVWWREQMDGVFAGVARKGHPVLEALTDVAARRGPRPAGPRRARFAGSSLSGRPARHAGPAARGGAAGQAAASAMGHSSRAAVT